MTLRAILSPCSNFSSCKIDPSCNFVFVHFPEVPVPAPKNESFSAKVITFGLTYTMAHRDYFYLISCKDDETKSQVVTCTVVDCRAVQSRAYLRTSQVKKLIIRNISLEL